MEFVQYRTGTDDAGRRLDKVLRILFPATPLSTIYNCLRKGLIRVNEKKVKQDYHIVSGDVIFVAGFLDFTEKSTKEHEENTCEKPDIPCIFQNEHILILNKPYDMPVHETGSFKGMTLNQYVLKTYPSKTESLSFTPGPLHRLDRKTTGLIAFSQSITGAHCFTELIKMHEIKKHYLSLVEGCVKENMTFSDMIFKDETDRDTGFKKVHIVDAADKIKNEGISNKAKNAVTRIKPVAYGKFNDAEISLIDIEIETGRTHQIRSQCAQHGFPLLGDTAYGGLKANGIFLHAYKLEIPLPNALGLPNALSAPLPERFLQFVENYLPTADLSPYNK